MKKIKIIGIGGSPRKKSNSNRMVEEVLKGASDFGAETEMILLGDLKIEFCDGCLSCDKTGRCHFSDEMNEICEKMAKADGLVFGTPARFDNVSGLMKNFIDRTNPLCKDSQLKGKKGALVTAGYFPKDISRERTIGSLTNFCEAHKTEVIGNVLAYTKTGKPREIEKMRNVLSRCYELGKKLVQSI